MSAAGIIRDAAVCTVLPRAWEMAAFLAFVMSLYMRLSPKQVIVCVSGRGRAAAGMEKRKIKSTSIAAADVRAWVKNLSLAK
jgi:hypothetical protein